MIAVFWDRKNSRTVRSDQLFPTNCIAEVIQGDSQESDYLKEPLNKLFEPERVPGEGGGEYPGLLSWHTIQIATLGYKSEKCPSYMNYDLQCLLSDLVFLELVE